MIYLNLLIDYLICNFSIINSYFILIELDRRSFFDVFLCGMIVSVIFCDLLFLLVLLLIYFLFRLINFKRKFIILKNILILIVYVLMIDIFHIFI